VGAEAKGISVAAERPDDVITSGDELVIRLLEPCNARCDFCACIGVMADAAPGRELVRRQLVEGFEKGYRNVVFTGGEPTLLPDLPDTIALAREAGFTRVSLQTNGVRLRDEDLARRLAEAGLDQVLMSIHSHRAEVHDAVLKLPGALDDATAGIGHLMKHRVRVWLNFVVHTHNMADLHDFLLWVYRRWERTRPHWHGHVGVTLSYVAPIGWTLEHMEIVPRLTDAAPHLARALDLAEAVDLKVRVPGLCGVPLCTMPGYESFLDESRGGAVPRLDTRAWVPACEGCGFRDRCSGYWTAYFDRFGTEEIGPGVRRPWARAPDDPPPAPVLDAILKLARRGQTPWLIAKALNDKAVRTPRGGRWSVDGVARLLRERGVPFVEELPPPPGEPSGG
jgi:pyruvate-formate lyase-activating enzyme